MTNRIDELSKHQEDTIREVVESMTSPRRCNLCGENAARLRSLLPKPRFEVNEFGGINEARINRTVIDSNVFRSIKERIDGVDVRALAARICDVLNEEDYRD